MTISLDGRDDVPTNAVLVADTWYPLEGVLRLADGSDAGEAIELDLSDSVAPLPALSPNTAYVLDLFDAGTIPEELPPVEEQDEAALRRVSFTTAAGPDEEAPAAPELGEPAVEKTGGAFKMDSCGPPYPVWEPEKTIFSYQFTYPDDAVALIAKREGDPADARAFIRYDDEDEDVFVLSLEDGEQESWELVFIDNAGNESAPTLVDADQAEASGCSQGAALPLLAGLLPLLARRRRKS